MRIYSLAFLVLALWVPQIASGAVVSYTGGFQTFTAPTTGMYNIVAYGAQGGNPAAQPARGGLGAQIGGDFFLSAGEILNIAVGGQGANNNFTAGGGGGTFVVMSGNVPLIIAGGGGGARGLDTGGPGLAGTAGGAAVGNGGPGGVLGNGGSGGGFAGGGGGGGFLTDGGDGGSGPLGLGGDSYLNGLAGGSGVLGASGSFGGGGGSGTNGGGGGGGYSGGGGAGDFGVSGAGGGGGSFNGSTLLNANFINLSGVNSGNGRVEITELGPAASVPEPSSILLFATGLSALVARRRASQKIKRA